MSVLGEVFIGALYVAGIASVLTYLGWLAVQWVGNIYHLFREEVKREDRDRH